MTLSQLARLYPVAPDLLVTLAARRGLRVTLAQAILEKGKIECNAEDAPDGCRA